MLFLVLVCADMASFLTPSAKIKSYMQVELDTDKPSINEWPKPNPKKVEPQPKANDLTFLVDKIRADTKARKPEVTEETIVFRNVFRSSSHS